MLAPIPPVRLWNGALAHPFPVQSIVLNRSYWNQMRQVQGVKMGEMLQQGDRLPKITLTLLDGGTITLPNDAPTRYTALLFYRGHW